MPVPHPLLVLVDPLARRTDGESVRIARDVLAAGSPGVKVCLPDGPEEAARALARRGRRRPVVIGDDRALLRAVRLLHLERGLAHCALSVVPVGRPGSVALAGTLGVPLDAVRAARTVLEGRERRFDLLTDDSGGVVLGDLRIPPLLGDREPRDGAGGPARGPLGRCRSLVRTLARPAPGPGAARLRVEADGVLLTDLDNPVERVSLTPGGGLVDVVVRRRAQDGPVRARARTVTVSGPHFRYRADAVVSGPVLTRTWTAHPSALRLTVPPAGPSDTSPAAPPAVPPQRPSPA
ncbi:diacylglycerol kinase [Streptomyces sp. CNQ085]|uniref:diacylglycerol kinase n=1 Tax=Streptomyces sp. CNQ085 TaxID=2886944 RepID=UPI001F507981|nr:diacylglycerol kinase [Streptomyces sp. CNQ085]MCI0383491.1 diacylglycerol kinase [Streptomyces sp. CNQ085]